MTLKQRLTTTPGLVVSGAILLLLGGGIGAVAAHGGHDRRVEAMAPTAPVAIAALAQASQPLVRGAESLVTVRGRIAQLFGNQFVLTDGSGQVLVDTGSHRGSEDTATTLAVGQTVAVQGRYEDGVLRARHLVTPDGRVAALGGRGSGGRHGRGGHEGRRGGRGGAESGPPEAPVPPAPPAGNAAAPAQ
ncbi:MAG TPA: hypothetical protein VGB79_15565 [Allosphingosinicella sp.]|jgi:uncharacterized protein YdeI (BOF family)